MIDIRHIGVYVADLPRMEAFYENAFEMKVICRQTKVAGELIDTIIEKGAEVTISKLVSPRGAALKMGEMIELICVAPELLSPPFEEVFRTGQSHIGIGVDDMKETIERIVRFGGTQRTPIIQIGTNKCCFCTDPENRWLELIQNG